MLDELRRITQEEIYYTPSNWDFVLALFCCILFLPVNILIDLFLYVADKYLKMLACYCKFKGER